MRLTSSEDNGYQSGIKPEYPGYLLVTGIIFKVHLSRDFHLGFLREDSRGADTIGRPA